MKFGSVQAKNIADHKSKKSKAQGWNKNYTLSSNSGRWWIKRIVLSIVCKWNQ